jgi:hypothetical protein
MPSEDLGLPIERCVAAVLADQHLGDEPRRGQTLGDQTVRCRHLMDRAASAAAVFGATNAHDAQLRRDPVEHLARRLADRMEAAATGWALMALKIEPHFLPR